MLQVQRLFFLERSRKRLSYNIIASDRPLEKMDLDQQLENLIKEAPKYGVPALVMERGVIPVLKSYAQQLDHQKYYLRQSVDENLLLTVLANTQNPQQEKRVIYAFPALKDAANFQGSEDPTVVAQVFPVGQILFQMFTMKEVDSIIFIDRPHDLKQSKEIYCKVLQNAIQEQLKNLLTPNSPPNNIA